MKDNTTDKYDLSCIEAKDIRTRQADMTRTVLDRTTHMDKKQKALLWMILDQGASYDQIARITGEHASTVSRRFRTMLRRLRGPLPRGTNRPPQGLYPLDKSILIESFIHGSSQKQIAAKLGVTRYRVRKVLDRFKSGKQE